MDNYLFGILFACMGLVAIAVILKLQRTQDELNETKDRLEFTAGVAYDLAKYSACVTNAKHYDEPGSC